MPKAGTGANVTGWLGPNIGDQDNYVVLEPEGSGHMVGLHLQINSLGGGWYGEVGHMAFIDGRLGEHSPPALHNTGSEETLGGAARPNAAYWVPTWVSICWSSQLSRAACQVPMVSAGSDLIRMVSDLEHRARARQQLRERLYECGLLLPDQVARGVCGPVAGGGVPRLSE